VAVIGEMSLVVFTLVFVSVLGKESPCCSTVTLVFLGIFGNMLASVLLFGGDDFFISTSSELESSSK
jgi:hypothetical protein